MNTTLMPPGIAALPKTDTGMPIPWFVAEQPDGKRDFRIVDSAKLGRAIAHNFCWICGRPMQRWKTFVMGPMCVIQRITTEPPSHADCAIYAARVCPFLGSPTFGRREVGLPHKIIEKTLEMADHNPGITCLWTTAAYHQYGNFFHPADTSQLAWYRERRVATESEIVEALIDARLRLSSHPSRRFTDVELNVMFEKAKGASKLKQ
jgi:hypothetical protein